MSDETPRETVSPDEPLRRDRGAVRNPVRSGRGLRAFPLLIASVGLEIVGEIVFAGLIALVSFLVYGEVRWFFVATVWLAVNGVLLLLTLILWLRRRSRR